MPELLAGDIGWLVGGGLFAWELGALGRLAVCAACPGGAAKPRCGRRTRGGGRGRMAAAGQAKRGGLVALAWLLIAPLALVVAGTVHGMHAVSTIAAGALFGAWLARRRIHPLRSRLVATAGCAIGAAAVAGGFALHLLTPRAGMPERGALYVAVSLGAWMLAASASAWFIDLTHEGLRARRRTARFASVASTVDDWTTCGFAVALCIALAYGFVAADTSAPCRLAALIAASGLASALGVRMMTGARTAAASRRPPAAGWRAPVARADAPPVPRVSLAGIPDELLVAACGGETFDAACLLPFARDDFAHAATAAYGGGASSLPRRQRGRYAGNSRWIAHR